MTLCIRSLLIHCGYLKELFILPNIILHYQLYYNYYFFLIITIAFLRFLYLVLNK